MKIRPMRGQVVVREERSATTTIWTPDPNKRNVKTHIGRVLALGPPARTSKGVEVPYGFEVGDVVQFHFEHNESLCTNTWEDGKPAVWIPQQDIDGVWSCR